MNHVTFGSLTAKNLSNINFDKLDLNNDGVVTQEELESVLDKKELDVLDLSSIDKDADQKVTKEEYELWQQEAQMHDYLDTMKNQAAREMIGQNPEDIKNFMDKLTDFANAFEQEYRMNNKNINGMSKAFMQELSQKYNDMKRDVLRNTKVAIRDRVVKNIISEFLDNDQKSGNSFAKLIDKKSSTLSDNAKRLLTNELTREAEAFISKYKGDSLESDLADYLRKYLKESDKEKLADAVGIWEKGAAELENLEKDLAYYKLKEKTKILLLSAIEKDINLKLGDYVVRTDANIMPAIAQFKDFDSLRWAVNKAITELSTKNRIEELEEQEQAKREAALQQTYEDLNFDESPNIFG